MYIEFSFNVNIAQKTVFTKYFKIPKSTTLLLKIKSLQ